MSTILLSFEHDWFEMLKSGQKKFEYRKHFPKGNTTVYFYVSRPVMAITGVAHFSNRERLEDWKDLYCDRGKEVVDRIADMMTDCRYAMPCLDFQPTNKIPLTQLREEIPGFIVPRMYYYIDDTPLLEYLEKNLHPTSDKLIHFFEIIEDDDIC